MPPFPSGRGLLVFICKGLRPLHPRARAESGTGCTCVAGTQRGACPAGRRLTLPLALFLAPIPPPPLPPPGKGESQSLFRRGLRPRHPCTEPPTALADAAIQEPGGWLARQVAGSPCLKLYWLPPSPLTPFPSGRGLLVFLCKGLRPLHPRGLNPWFAEKPTGSNSLRVVPPGFSLRAPQRQSL